MLSVDVTYLLGECLDRGAKEDPVRGAFKNHVDKRGWVGGLKFSIFVHV